MVRASGVKNPDYKGPWAFTNDFASFSFDAPDVSNNSKFQKVRPVHGTCRVICYTPRHNVTLAQLPIEEVEAVVRLWKNEYETLSQHEKIKNVLIFENKGKVIGVSNPHPHGQIYATNFVPRIVDVNVVLLLNTIVKMAPIYWKTCCRKSCNMANVLYMRMIIL